MSDVIIRAENLGKKYTIGHQAENGRYVALRDVLVHNAKNLWNKTKDLVSGNPIIQGDTTEEVWALKDLNFEVKRGEALGIIGRNGAGKSTLLKILSRITEPTTGRITIKGRVASLLEVGTGFHPELSGRENIYLNGTILGMTRAEIKKKFDEIVAFAEIEKYLDTPVKRYSSGMYVRLAFAVAAHLEPEILVVDEVLAVGDAQFQKKCLGKMEDVSFNEGRTILFVSHNMAHINNLCSSCILLEAGKLSKKGVPSVVIQDYLSQEETAQISNLNNNVIWVDQDLDLLDFYCYDDRGQKKKHFKTSENINVHVKYLSKRDINGLRVGFDLIGFSDGDVLFRTFDDDLVSKDRKQGISESICSIPKNLLKPGTYSIRLQIGIHNIRWICDGKISEKITIELIDGINSSYADSRPGKIMPHIDWK